MEHNQLAADGTIYDNGYGICMIPQTQLTTTTWHKSNNISGYMSSTMHTSHLPGIVTNLQNVLGSHIVQRNVLLSSSLDNNGYSNGYTWTTAKATLMSVGQMTGIFAANGNKYDDGEANYKLPVFNYKEYKTGSSFWSRGVWGLNKDYYYYFVWNNDGDGSFKYTNPIARLGVRPLIYLR